MKRVKETKLKLEKKEANIVGHLCYAAFKLWNVLNYERLHYEELGLKEIEALHARAEELGRNKEYREKFDLVVSRAVANLSSLEEYCVPFVKIGGNFISYKSGEIEEEVANAKNATFLLGGKLKEVYKFDLYEQKRSFVVIDKMKGTPKTYPRKAGTPTKTPL